jgi:hypothetical protein
MARRLAGLTALLAILHAWPAAAQQAPPASTSPTVSTPSAAGSGSPQSQSAVTNDKQSSPQPGAVPSAENLQRIQTALAKPPTVRIDGQQLRFYAEVVAKMPTFADFIGSGEDLKSGPVKGAGMTHQEFVNMVTPQLVNSSAGITGIETLQFALTNWAAQSLIRKAMSEFREARSEAEVRAIRERIDKELAALREAAD